MEVLVVDDRPRRAANLRALTRHAFPDVQLRSACTLVTGLQQARNAGPLDLVVLKLDLPGCSGIEALQRFRAEFPSLRVLAASAAEDPALAAAALEAGAVGYLPASFSLFATTAALRLVAEGGLFIPAGESLRAAREAGRTATGLTRREMQLLRLVANGSNRRDIARALNVAEETVEQHVQEALRAVGA